MELIDLHVHSNVSDGTLTPSEVVELAVAKQLTAVALTDHDTVDGVEEAVRAAEGTPLEIISGTELSCVYREKEIHMLGLFIDHTSGELTSSLLRQRFLRKERNAEMIRRFSEGGMPFTMEELEEDNPGAVITRAHFARVLLKKGYVSSADQAFKKYLDQGKKYFIPKQAYRPEEAIRLIRNAGGFPAVAHPILYKLGWKETERMIAELKDMGLMGVEVYYSSHRPYESMRLREICLSQRLLPTGGSDFHGANKPDIELGTGRGGLRVPALLLSDIRAALPR